MSQDNQQQGLLSPADEVSVKKLIRGFGDHRRYVASRWKFLFIAAIIGGAIGLMVSLFTKTTYTAECTFVIEEGDKSGGGLSQYSGLAAMAGIDIPGGSSGLFQSDNIMQLYKSRLMVEKTLLTPAVISDKQQLLVDKYIEVNKLRDAWGDNAELAKLSFDIPRKQFTMAHDSIMNQIVSDINKNYLSVEKPDKKMSLVSVKVKAPDQRFAKAFTETIVGNVNSFYVQTKTKKAQTNMALLQKQADSVHRVVNSSVGRAASAIDANPNPDPANVQTLRAPSQRRQIDLQAATAIYQEVVRNLEIARAALQRETPLIQVIDEPVLPLQKDRVGKIKGVAIGVFIGLVIGILWLVSNRVYRNIMV